VFSSYFMDYRDDDCMRSKPLVVNLFAGPGAGKSTGAAYIFSELKMGGIECELVREYIKDKLWERNAKVFGNQPYIFGKQYHRMFILEGEVEVIVTDSPLILPVLYNTNEYLDEEAFEKMAIGIFNSYENMNYFLDRVKPYNENGRNQTLVEAIGKDEEVLDLLDRNCIEYQRVNGDESGYESIVGNIISRLDNED